jgi:hypothetical protein
MRLFFLFVSLFCSKSVPAPVQPIVRVPSRRERMARELMSKEADLDWFQALDEAQQLLDEEDDRLRRDAEEDEEADRRDLGDIDPEWLAELRMRHTPPKEW